MTGKIMQFNIPKDTNKIAWTKHSIEKMKFYGLSTQRVLSVLRHPDRCQEAVAPGCVACMQIIGQKRKTEIWMMYQIIEKSRREVGIPTHKATSGKKIITAWRYPGVSPIQDKIPIPDDILEELNSLII